MSLPMPRRLAIASSSTAVPDVHVTVLAYRVHRLTRAGLGGEMHDGVGTVQREPHVSRTRHAAAHESNRIANREIQRRRVRLSAVNLRRQGVEHRDGVSSREEVDREPRADEPGPARDQHALHRSLRTLAACAKTKLHDPIIVAAGPPSISWSECSDRGRARRCPWRESSGSRPPESRRLARLPR